MGPVQDRTRQPSKLTRCPAPGANRPPLSGAASMLAGVHPLREPLTVSQGPRTASKLAEVFGLHTVGDLLRHYPRRYYTRGELTDLSALRDGDHVTALARVESGRGHPRPL